MKNLTLITSLLLLSCANTAGLSSDSSKSPAGNPKSSIVVEEFSDFQCPACRGAHIQVTKPLLEKYGRNIRYEFNHFPLRQIHPFAQSAAEASECAADQGKFWEFVDDSFENQSQLSESDLIARAQKVGVADTELFSRCLKSGIKKDVVDADYDEGVQRGVRGTPTFFVSGVRVPRHTLEAISSMIEERMGKQKL